MQFRHQDVQYGVAAFFTGSEWEYDNAYIDVESGEMTGFNDTTGSFTPGSPALLTIRFDKRHFPHGDASDNRLVDFQAATADFKPIVPWGFSPAPIPVPPPNGGFVVCDLAEGDGTYTFQVGGHSAHGGGNATAPAGGASSPASGGGSAGANATDPAGGGDVTRAGGAPASTNESPGAGALGAILACVGAAVVARRRRS